MINSGTSYHITKQRSYQRLAVPSKRFGSQIKQAPMDQRSTGKHCCWLVAK